MNYNNNLRTKEFKENESLNIILNELSKLLSPVQSNIEKSIEGHQWPFGFIIGSPRSGTTLLSQWLASLGTFSYPSNFLTRFAYAPYIGAMVQKIIFEKEYDYQNDFSDINSGVNFDSNLGKSSGALAVNEFQHFFRTYMNHFEPKYISSEEISSIDFDGIQRGLSSIEKVFNKPFITKASLFKYNILDLTKAISNSIVLFIKRDPIFNMQSLLQARQKYYGDIEIWYGSKPKEYDKLFKLDVYHQIAGQVYFTNKRIEQDLMNLDRNKYIIITYEAFCKNPESVYSEIKNIYRFNGVNLSQNYEGPDQYTSTNAYKMNSFTIKKLSQAYEEFCKADTL